LTWGLLISKLVERPIKCVAILMLYRH